MIEHQFVDLPEVYKTAIPPIKDMRTIKPTPECPKGIKGRVAVFEMYEMDRKLESIILTKPTENEIYDYVRKEKGMITMKEDAIIKALQKMIPFEEIGNL